MQVDMFQDLGSLMTEEDTECPASLKDMTYEVASGNAGL